VQGAPALCEGLSIEYIAERREEQECHLRFPVVIGQHKPVLSLTRGGGRVLVPHPHAVEPRVPVQLHLQLSPTVCYTVECPREPGSTEMRHVRRNLQVVGFSGIGPEQLSGKRVVSP